MSFFSRLRFKYKVVILNENTLETKFHTRISMLSMMAWISLFTIVSFTLLSVIILATPLKYMLPGYAEMSIREDVINDALRIDSLSNKMELANRQLFLMKNVLAGNIAIDSINEADTLTIEQLKKMPLGASKAENEFTAHYEDANIYNINDYLPTELRPEEIVFVIPVHGAIKSRFNANVRSYGVSILSSPDKPVLAAHSGKIIYSTDNVYDNTIIIAHADEYVTIYRHLGRLLHRAGETVVAGEAVAFVGYENSRSEYDSTIEFELWHKGVPLDPETYILF